MVSHTIRRPRGRDYSSWRRDVELAALILELADDLFATSRGEKLPWSKYPGW
jgi:hypothetical protein